MVWFDCSEPYLTTPLQVKQSLQGVYVLVQADRTSLNHIDANIARCVEFLNMSSGWFDFTEPSLTTSVEWKKGVHGAD